MMHKLQTWFWQLLLFKPHENKWKSQWCGFVCSICFYNVKHWWRLFPQKTELLFRLFTVLIKPLCVSYFDLQSAAGKQGAEGQSGRAPVRSGDGQPPCGGSGDLPEKCWAQPRRGPETQQGTPDGNSAVPHQAATSSHLTDSLVHGFMTLLASTEVHLTWTDDWRYNCPPVCPIWA